MNRKWIRVVAVAVFVAITTTWIYGGWGQPRGHGVRALPEFVQIGALLVAYPLMGYFVGRWWAVGLIFLPILIAMPAGPIVGDEDGMAIWAAVLIATITVLGPLGLAGVIVRRLHDRYGRPSGRFSPNTREAPDS